ncbi:MAG: hypothetical protein Q8P40_10660 [Nitrospirota bacterium]|nr:hypothetical protein [Nitrospirota bacterium]
MRNIKETMGKIYKDKKSKGCALCKPHKHGWAPKKKAKIIALEKEMDREINKETSSSVQKN